MNWLTQKSASLARGLAQLSPDCKHAVRLQSEALDHPLNWRERLGLRFHLWLCKWCRRYGRQIKFLRAAARCNEPGLDAQAQALSPEASERIKRKLDPGNG